jgi:hypothetical protein
VGECARRIGIEILIRFHETHAGRSCLREDRDAPSHGFYTKHSHKQHSQSGPKNTVPATNILMPDNRVRPCR